MKIRVAALMLLAMPLSACVSSNLMVEQAARGQTRVSSVNLAYQSDAAQVEAEAASYLQRRMELAFTGGAQPPFSSGQEMTVRYRFISYARGSRLARYMLPGIAGGATMLIEAEFVSPSGQVMGRVRGQGRVAGGLVGGSHNSAIDTAVNQIRDYAIANFRR